MTISIAIATTSLAHLLFSPVFFFSFNIPGEKSKLKAEATAKPRVAAKERDEALASGLPEEKEKLSSGVMNIVSSGEN